MLSIWISLIINCKEGGAPRRKTKGCNCQHCSSQHPSHHPGTLYRPPLQTFWIFLICQNLQTYNPTNLLDTFYLSKHPCGGTVWVFPGKDFGVGWGRGGGAFLTVKSTNYVLLRPWEPLEGIRALRKIVMGGPKLTKIGEVPYFGQFFSHLNAPGWNLNQGSSKHCRSLLWSI